MHSRCGNTPKLFAFVTMIFAIFQTMSMVSLNKIGTRVLEHEPKAWVAFFYWTPGIRVIFHPLLAIIYENFFSGPPLEKILGAPLPKALKPDQRHWPNLTGEKWLLSDQFCSTFDTGWAIQLLTCWQIRQVLKRLSEQFWRGNKIPPRTIYAQLPNAHPLHGGLSALEPNS